ncbi:MAG TPA: Rieske 2Fe-2S domain-containing protein [Kofleriaceae bacterium]|nr:Rieske 2Fe-2S domain-containing protein [Kofleriaceae bacterium]
MADIDPRVDNAAREGLAGTTPTSVYEPTRDPEDVTVAPDHRPMDEQPKWRRDFAIDVPEDNFVARRDFAKFLVLTSGAFVAGQAWVAAKSLVRRRDAASPRMKIASLSRLSLGSAIMFAYPTGSEPCLLIRTRDGRLLAYSQKCTHLSCAVIPELDRGILRCPCHDGIFELSTGRNIAGPPPRPLPAISIEVVGDDVYATGVVERMS